MDKMDLTELQTNVGRDPLLVTREATHGSFKQNAMTHSKLWGAVPPEASMKLSIEQHLALNMIFLKIARLLSNPRHRDSWDDVAGYAKLGSEACDG